MALFDKIMEVYESAGYISQQRAKIVNSLSLLLLGIEVATSLHVFFVLNEREFYSYIILFLSFSIYFIILALLKRGFLGAATLILIIYSCLAVWALMFVEAFSAQLSVVFATDTIVFIYGQLFFTILMSSTRKLFIRLYFIANLIIMIIYTYLVFTLYQMPGIFLSEFLGDNILGFLLVYLLSSVFRRMNENALARVEKEVARNKKLAESLEKRVELRTDELQHAKDAAEQIAVELHKTRGQLANTAHKAGMSDIATSVLHNIGNVLNTVVVSTDLIRDILTRSKIPEFSQAMELLRQQEGNWDYFFSEDSKGKALLEFFTKIDTVFQNEKKLLSDNTEILAKKISLVCDILDSQQEYVYAIGWTEAADINQIIKDALVILAESLHSCGIQVETDYQVKSPVLIQKNKLIHILINLLRNARDALEEGDRTEKRIWIRSYDEGDMAHIEVQDNGCGILEEDLSNIFKHGFTTKSNGSGFGLHSAANHMTEMQGSIRAFSEGPGMGATFLLTLPLHTGENLSKA